MTLLDANACLHFLIKGALHKYNIIIFSKKKLSFYTIRTLEVLALVMTARWFLPFLVQLTFEEIWIFLAFYTFEVNFNTIQNYTVT